MVKRKPVDNIAHRRMKINSMKKIKSYKFYIMEIKEGYFSIKSEKIGEKDYVQYAKNFL